ncbi:MAG TPA: flavin reductase family protein [Candidatus Thermoplasmatota archaeon]|nr:flavin reductase family protein [Candidatus Thermoplasmatota archaeon]
MKHEGTLEHYYHYAFPTQTVLVTCNDKKGNTNIITLAWHTPISRQPPLYGISVAPKRYSYGLIKETEEFVVNFIPYSLVEAAQFCGTHSGQSAEKVCKTGLTLLPSDKLATPRIKEGYAHLECTLEQDIQLGDHQLLVGKVVGVSADDDAFKDELLRTNHIHPLYYIGDNAYTTLDSVKRRAF